MFDKPGMEQFCCFNDLKINDKVSHKLETFWLVCWFSQYVIFNLFPTNIRDGLYSFLAYGLAEWVV